MAEIIDSHSNLKNSWLPIFDASASVVEIEELVEVTFIFLVSFHYHITVKNFDNQEKESPPRVPA